MNNSLQTPVFPLMKFHLILVFLLLAQLVMAQGRLQVVQDTVRVLNSELVIRNSTSNIPGYLYNKGNGITEFRPAGGQASFKSLQFKVGTTQGSPAAGTASYINSLFIGNDIKVWRNSDFQYRDSTGGILLDTALGKITFIPALASGDRIYIESFGGSTVFQGSIFGSSSSLPASAFKLQTGIFPGDTSFTLRWGVSNLTLSASPRVVGIGSSTLEGYNLPDVTDKLGYKIETWLTNLSGTSNWLNLAKGGYTSVSLQRMSDGGDDAARNIEAALKANPDFIFLSLASNDPGEGIPVSTTLNNYRRLDTIALNRGIPIFFETTQPRTGYSTQNQEKLRDLADSIRNLWPDRYVEGFSNLVDAAEGPAVILQQYRNPLDAIHLNGAGSQVIANSLFARWQSYFQPVTGVSKYVVESSTNQSTWTQLEEITNANIVKKVYQRPDTLARYYRVKTVYSDGSSPSYGNIVYLPVPDGPEPPAQYASGGRILVDLGGDGFNTVNGTNNPDGDPTPSPDNFGHYWNNWFGKGLDSGFVSGAEINNLVTTTNAVTPIDIELIGNAAGTFGDTKTKAMNFTGYFSALNDYPYQALSDNMFLHSSIGSNGVTLRVKGLTKSKKYSIKLWGARIDNATTPRILEAKLGSEPWTNSQTVNTRLATATVPGYDNAIFYQNITNLDSVDINVRVGAGSSLAHISLIEIDTITHVLPIVTLRDTSATLPKDSIQLIGIINPNGSTIATYQWTNVSGPNVPTFSNPNGSSTVVRNLTNGIFRVKLTVTTTTGRAISSTANIHVYPNNAGKKTMRVYFSATPAPAIPGWMNAYGPVDSNHVVVSDATTDWGIDNGGSTSAYWNPYVGSNAGDTAGHITGNNSGVVPDIALDGYWFNSSKQFTTNNNVIITGLNPAKTYTIKLVGSRSTAGAPPRYSAWHINNGSEILFNAYANTSQAHTQTGVSPYSNGEIRIGVYSPVSSTYGSFSYINALIVQEE